MSREFAKTDTETRLPLPATTSGPARRPPRMGSRSGGFVVGEGVAQHLLAVGVDAEAEAEAK
jgi:hypothetical protein